MKFLVQTKRFIKSSRLYRFTHAGLFKLFNLGKEEYFCPICDYKGPFADVAPASGIRKHDKCPSCGSYVRHRLQKLVLEKLQENYDFSRMRMLHFAPENFFRDYFKNLFKDYITADLYMKDVDLMADLTKLPFKDSEFDIVFASHVLEHIKNDITALSEIRRVLKPKGIAVLPVPLIGERTVEYPEPNPHEFDHVRAPGLDYFNRYSSYFSHVEKFSSDNFPNKYQLFLYEDRSIYPTEKCPLRLPTVGDKHIDIVPVCFV